MNPPIKRLLALAGSLVAGLFGVLVLASPAQAHHPIVSGTADCQADGQYKITWTVSNGNWDNPFMKIKEVKANPDTPLNGIAAGPDWIDPDQSVTGTQMVPGTTTSASLWVDGLWFKKKTDTAPKVHNSATGYVKLAGTCKAEPNPTTTFTDRCDGTTNVHLVNPAGTKKSFRIKGTGFDKTVDVNAKSELDVSVPASAGAITVSVKNGENWTEIGKHNAWARPDECPPPTVFSWSTCDTLTVKVTNAENAEPTTAEVTYGSQVKTADVAPGKTEVFEFDAGGATEATVKLAGWPSQTVKYERPATACETLPKTGSGTTTLLASGSGLAMLGGLAFFFARRRMAQLRKLASN